MRRPTTTDLYVLAWRHVRRLPDAPVRGLAHLVADLVWLGRSGGVRQLERNLRRLRPDLDERALRRTSRAGMRSYLRYFVEAFQLPGWSHEQIDARVRAVGVAPVRDAVARGESPVLALGHAGNWDLAGAWASRALAPVLTVAEKLPDGLYEEFVSFRASLGIEIVPLEGGSTFRRLTRMARTHPQIVPLLADRDLTAHGVEVDLLGSPARVAAGPASLALVGGHPLVPVAITYERLRGADRRRAGTPWGLVIEFAPFVATADDDGARRGVADVTQDWVTALFERVARSPQDWHMLQKVYLADLDPARLRSVPTAGE
ncbi:phosphatidylinositol mannoside acyltransferase [Litorihabitans aurantiacus]|uniref:Lipid A biosynthesis lauroyl acyltransferase n=1 Tax=Litorihabitans aurantiacus TaxID=1930061 RepID=A0AA37XDY3_9MICO|nr:phosphatidylinositol mannoside acyltransferase [Litorihabitans aurantiacus]GMA31387.1 lipid A biosynthesis lauroyl acyltransferase [Litorihabitans aurantiacus]